MLIARKEETQSCKREEGPDPNQTEKDKSFLWKENNCGANSEKKTEKTEKVIRHITRRIWATQFFFQKTHTKKLQRKTTRRERQNRLELELVDSVCFQCKLSETSKLSNS